MHWKRNFSHFSFFTIYELFLISNLQKSLPYSQFLHTLSTGTVIFYFHPPEKTETPLVNCRIFAFFVYIF
jgi:hypothetical protein